MTTPGRPQPNINQQPGRLKELKKSAPTSMKSHDGFVGKPGAVHLHLVGKRWHLKLGKNQASRVNFTQTDDKQVKSVLTLLRTDSDYKNKPGAAECIMWCEQPAAKRV